MVQYFTNNQFFCSTIIFVLLSMLGPCCRLSCLILYIHIYIYYWIIPKDGNMFPGWLRMIFASWFQVCNFYFMCFVFGSWPFRSRIWSVDDYGDDDDDDDDVVAMWQCGTQNEGPRKKSLQLSTAEHWEPVGFQEKTCRSKLRNWGMRTTRTMRSPCECLERPQADPVVWRL